MLIFLWGLQGDLITVSSEKIAEFDRKHPRSTDGFYWDLCFELAQTRLNTEFSDLLTAAIAESGSGCAVRDFAFRFQFVCAEEGTFINRAELHRKMIDNGEPMLRILVGTVVDIAGVNEYPLIGAAEDGLLARVNLLIATGVNLERKDREGRTALHMVTIRNRDRCHERVAIVKALIEAGADIDATDNTGSTALFHAANPVYFVPFYDVVETLLKAGANTETAATNGDTPLLRAIKIGRDQSAQLLIDSGANVSAMNRKRELPLEIAIRDGNVAIVKSLLDTNADIHSAELVRTLWDQLAVWTNKATIALLEKYLEDKSLLEDQ